jgi:hypothetical protein
VLLDLALTVDGEDWLYDALRGVGGSAGQKFYNDYHFICGYFKEERNNFEILEITTLMKCSHSVQMYRITVRATNESALPHLVNNIKDVLANREI